MYWELTQYDGTVTHIPPDAVAVVKRRMENGQPINTKTATIPHKQIKSFRISEKPHSEQPLLDAASQAFNEPELTDDGSIVYRWVKTRVTKDKWERHYSRHNGVYKPLDEEDGLLWVAFRLPIHEIDIQKLSYCSDEEERKLEQKLVK